MPKCPLHVLCEVYRGGGYTCGFVYTAHGEMPSLVRRWLFRWKRRVKRQLLNWKLPLVSYYNPLHSLGVYMYTWQVSCLSLLNYDTLRTIPVGFILSFLGLWSCLPFLLLATLSDVLGARLQVIPFWFITIHILGQDPHVCTFYCLLPFLNIRLRTSHTNFKALFSFDACNKSSF